MARRNQQMNAHNIRYILVVLKWAVTWILHPHSKKDGYKNDLKKWSQKIRQYFVFVGFMSWSSIFFFFSPTILLIVLFLLMFISSDSVAKLGVILRYPSKGSFKHYSKKIGILSFFSSRCWGFFTIVTNFEMRVMEFMVYSYWSYTPEQKQSLKISLAYLLSQK